MSAVKKSFAVFAVVVLCLSVSAIAAAARYKLHEGSVERTKSLLTAGPSGAVLQYPSGVSLRLHPHTKIRRHKDALVWLDSKGKTPSHTFTLIEGRAEFEVPVRSGRARQAALVRAGGKLTGATVGGRLTALAGEDYAVVASYSGKVMASDGGRWVKLSPGSAKSLSKRATRMAPHELPKAPNIKSERKLWLALKGTVSVGGFSWAGLENAASYSLVVSAKGGKNAVLRKRLTALASGPFLTRVPAGQYDLSVRAMDRYGLAGPAGTLTFNVVGVKNHRGSRVSPDGVVHVGINQRARFTFVDGLLMTYGTAGRWAAATETVPLWRNERTIVHFRHPEGVDIVSARLEPRGVSADVYIGPKTRVWPGGPVNISVKINDIKGGAPEDLDVKFNVFLGIQPMTVDWKKRGNSFTSQVAPQAGPGPWVLRVSVVDRFGIELGRDFLEISERSQSGERRKRTRRSKATSRSGGELARATGRTRE